MYVVVKHFNDLEDKGKYNAATSKYPRLGLEPSDERINLLLEKGYIKKIKDSTVSEDKSDKIEEAENELENLTVAKLKELADEKNIEYDSKVKKAKLVDLLKE